MNQQFESYLAQLAQVTSFEELNGSVCALRDALDVEHVVYHSVKNTGEQYAALTYSDAWVDHYIEDHCDRIDPVVQGAYQRFTPVDWQKLDWGSKPARALLADGRSEGLGNQGLSIPIRGPSGQFALFTVNGNAQEERWGRFVDAYQQDLLLIAHYINEKALALDGVETTNGRNHALSPRETDALSLLALGLSRGQAADRLKISEHTLRVYIEAARFKLNGLNTTHAVALALSRGLIAL